MHIDWMSDEMAAKHGLHTEEAKQEYLHQQREAGEKAANSWLNIKVRRARGKDTRGIPRGDYCYESWISEEHRAEHEALTERYGEVSPEVFLHYTEWVKERRCPYQEYTDYGTVICHFLEEEAIGYHEDDFEEAARHFGSEEEAERKCAGSILLYDAVRCCNRVLNTVEEEAKP